MPRIGDGIQAGLGRTNYNNALRGVQQQAHYKAGAGATMGNAISGLGDKIAEGMQMHRYNKIADAQRDQQIEAFLAIDGISDTVPEKDRLAYLDDKMDRTQKQALHSRLSTSISLLETQQKQSNQAAIKSVMQDPTTTLENVAQKVAAAGGDAQTAASLQQMMKESRPRQTMAEFQQGVGYDPNNPNQIFNGGFDAGGNPYGSVTTRPAQGKKPSATFQGYLERANGDEELARERWNADMEDERALRQSRLDEKNPKSVFDAPATSIDQVLPALEGKQKAETRATYERGDQKEIAEMEERLIAEYDALVQKESRLLALGPDKQEVKNSSKPAVPTTQFQSLIEFIKKSFGNINSLEQYGISPDEQEEYAEKIATEILEAKEQGDK